MDSRQQNFKKITIPSKNGISPSQVYLPKGSWKTIEDFLSERFPIFTREDWKKRITKGEILDANGHPVSSCQSYTPYQKLYYYRYLPHEMPIPFNETILYQDDWLVVADKPHFLPVTPSGKYVSETLLVRLKKRLGIETLTPIHRIDRETAGLVLFSVKPEGRDLYQRLFRENYVSKHYEAIAAYREDLVFPMRCLCRLEESQSFMKMCVAPGKPNSETEINLLSKNDNYAHYQLKPVTGRKHQLRVQMCSLGIPLLNDRIYPVHLPEALTEEMQAEEFRYPLQLVAKTITFTDPVSSKTHHFESRHSLDLNRVSEFIN